MSRLQRLFERLADAGLTINLSKSEFGHAKLVFLGNFFGPVNAKVEAIAGYYRQFVPNFANVSAPLTNLVSPKQEFVWTAECKSSFNKLKATLISAPILKSIDYNQPFTLHINASDKGIGAVLLQCSELGEIKIASTLEHSGKRKFGSCIRP